MSVLCYEASLSHHGVKGMKWGQRRFQNKDGSLKPAGEGRYDGNPVTPKKATPKKTTPKKANPKQVAASGAKKTAKLISSVGKTSVITAVRMTENRQRMKAVENFFNGDVGNAYSNMWAANKYSNIYNLF